MREYLFNYDAGAARAIPEGTLAALTKQRHPDAALVYLYLLQNGGKLEPEQAETDLGMDSDRLEMALAVLQRIRALRGGTEKVTEAMTMFERPIQSDEYSAREVEQAAKDNQNFRWLVSKLEKYLGRFPSLPEQKRVLYICHHVHLSLDILGQLLTYLGDEAIRNGKTISLARFQEMAEKWDKLGIDTDEKVEMQISHSSTVWKLWRSIGMGEKLLTQKDREFLQGWLDRGMPAELVQIACQKEVNRNRDFRGAYANSILEDWAVRGYRTVAEMERGEAKSGSQASQRGPAPQQPQAPVSPEAEAAYREEMRRLYEEFQRRNAETK